MVTCCLACVLCITIWIQTVINRLYRNVTLLFDIYIAFFTEKKDQILRFLNWSSNDVNWIDSINSSLTDYYHGIFSVLFRINLKERKIKLPKDVKWIFMQNIAVLEFKISEKNKLLIAFTKLDKTIPKNWCYRND